MQVTKTSQCLTAAGVSWEGGRSGRSVAVKARQLREPVRFTLRVLGELVIAIVQPHALLETGLSLSREAVNSVGGYEAGPCAVSYKDATLGVEVPRAVHRIGFSRHSMRISEETTSAARQAEGAEAGHNCAIQTQRTDRCNDRKAGEESEAPGHGGTLSLIDQISANMRNSKAGRSRAEVPAKNVRGGRDGS